MIFTGYGFMVAFYRAEGAGGILATSLTEVCDG